MAAVPTHDVIVIGAGISGLSFAFHAARAGKRVLLLEKDPRFGGCLHTEPASDGMWIELGGHTCYNSYGGFIELLEGVGLMRELQPRGKPVLRFIEGNRPLPGKNMWALLSRLSWWEALKAIPGWFGNRPEGQTVKQHYSRFVGPGNYQRVLGPMLSAVPSQNADDIPADMLFKKRKRRKDVMRSFTLREGLNQVAGAVVALPGVTAVGGRTVREIAQLGDAYVVTTDDGAREEAPFVAVATTPQAAAGLLAGVAPAAAEELRGIGEATVHSVGVVVPKDRVGLPYATFYIPTGDVFHSIVTRDVVDHPSKRGFVFHFKPGLEDEARRDRVREILGVPTDELELWRERRSVLPAPVLGHHERVRAVDAELAGTGVAVTGNYFAGLAIEDCVLRSKSEWERLAAVAS